MSASRPQDWPEKRLRFMATINPLPPSRQALPDDADVSFLPMEAIGEDGSLRLDACRQVADVRAGYSYFANGDVAFAKVTPCFENGKGALMRGLAGGHGFGTTELTVLRSGPTLEARFLHYFLQSPRFRQPGAGAMTGAGGLKRVPEEFTRNTRIPLPAMRVQRSVADFLDRETARIDALIEKKTRFIELLREKRQALITQAVTRGLDAAAPMKELGTSTLEAVPAHWTVARVKNFLRSLDGRRIPLMAVDRGARAGEFAYYGASGVIDWIDDYIFDEVLLLVSEDGANLLSRTSPIAFVARGRYWVNNHAHVLRPPDECLDFWAARIEAIDLVPFATGAAQPKLTIESLMNIPIAVPPTVAERKAIESGIAKQTAPLDLLVEKTRRSVELLVERRAALITAAVTGQFDVRAEAFEEQAEPA